MLQALIKFVVIALRSPVSPIVKALKIVRLKLFRVNAEGCQNKLDTLSHSSGRFDVSQFLPAPASVLVTPGRQKQGVRPPRGQTLGLPATGHLSKDKTMKIQPLHGALD